MLNMFLLWLLGAAFRLLRRRGGVDAVLLTWTPDEAGGCACVSTYHETDEATAEAELRLRLRLG
ncbi:MAG: hypothetical protein D6685_09255, partial [Bacteroidetes bacterium]